jgi:hypothetical protein
MPWFEHGVALVGWTVGLDIDLSFAVASTADRHVVATVFDVVPQQVFRRQRSAVVLPEHVSWRLLVDLLGGDACLLLVGWTEALELEPNVPALVYGIDEEDRVFDVVEQRLVLLGQLSSLRLVCLSRRDVSTAQQNAVDDAAVEAVPYRGLDPPSGPFGVPESDLDGLRVRPVLEPGFHRLSIPAPAVGTHELRSLLAD